MAYMLTLDLKRRAGDIEKAYCWAELHKLHLGKLITIRSPAADKRHNDQGEEL